MADTDTRLTGIVKWFNSKTGYGFITILGDDSRDIFVHFSNVKVDGLQYTYLVQGEYVEFDLVETGADNDKHTHHAVNITGIRGGPILCNTRFINRLQEKDTDNDDSDTLKRTVSAPASRTARSPRVVRAPRSSQSENEGFVKVEKKRRPPAKKTSSASV
uniref:CSD domain-containing protein n=1 Tax=viral metagenome TaxID=1070528 RepID=A0A6C0I0A3_9ZZZZ